MSEADALVIQKTGILDELSDITYKLEMQDRINGFADGGALQQRLAPLWPILAPHFPSIIDDFFTRLLKTDKARAAIDTSKLEAYKVRQIEFWHHLFTASMDRRWGQVISERGAFMHRIGLEPRYYLPAYAVIFDRALAHVAEALAGEPERLADAVVAINRLNFLVNEIMAATHHEMVREEAAEVLSAHGKRFESDVVATLKSAAESVHHMQELAERVGAAIEAMSNNSTSVANAADQSADNVRTAAAAAEELAASVQQLNDQMKRTTDASNEALSDAEAADQVIGHLAEFSEKIGHVIKLIDDIAGQTNLLALNAT
ncbi:MAG: globin-coupled sensor protein, partial [Alphaproteobacteria bacterium]